MSKKDGTRLVWVSWVDSALGHGWQSLASAQTQSEDNNMNCESVGWVVYDSKDRIGLCQSKSGSGYLSSPIIIPRCTITKIIDIVD